MSFYGNEPWSAPARQPSWEQQQQPPSRSGTASAGSREEPNAFAYQIAEVDRAIDNLMKSGKFPMLGSPFAGPRRDSVPAMGARPAAYPEFDPRLGPMQRPGSMGGEFDGMRQQSNSNLQNFYASQRFGPRNPEADQQMQVRRRQAAQRERELRNYHQEQQYQKNISGAKSDRSMSPNTGMNEDERRDLIARQHRALYGTDSGLYTDSSRPVSQDARVTSMAPFRGNGSPLAYDPFALQSQPNPSESAVQMPPRDQQSKPAQRSRANSTSSPSSNPTTSFSLFDAQHSSRTSTSSPTGGSPPRDPAKATGSVAPIGTRPAQSSQQQASNSNLQGTGSASNLQKRSTTPLPSPLSFGFSASDQTNERTTSASSNPPSSVADKPVLGWGGNTGVWGSAKGLGVQASVWG